MNKETKSNKKDRIFFLDNLRTVLIFLVILYHAGGVYESSVTWAFFWIVDDAATNDISGLIGVIIDIFVMALMFFIAGYFTPLSLKNKDSRSFLKSKFRRLIVPWMIAVLVFVPLYKVIFLASRNLPQEHWSTYFHFGNGFISQSWMWFLPVLFMFNVIYLVLSRIGIRVPNISLKWATVIVFLVGWLYSVGMDVFNLRGWTLTPLLDFQHERLLITFMFFLLGSLTLRLKVFDSKPVGNTAYNVMNAISWIPVTAYMVFLLAPILNPGSVIISEFIDRVLLWFFFQLSLLCIVYTLVESFRRYLDKSGGIWKELNQNSYYVYIIHVIVLGAVAMLMINVNLPSMAKYLILTGSTFVVSNVIVSLYYRATRTVETKRSDVLDATPSMSQ